jgi:glycerol-3-phosphate cytidylyltransferase
LDTRQAHLIHFTSAILKLLRRAKERCDYLVAGVVLDEVLIVHKGVAPVVPLVERIEIVRNCRYVDAAHAAMTDDKLEIWRDLRFNVFFKGDDWRGTEKGICLERQFAELDVEVVYFSYTQATSSSRLRRTLQNIDELAKSATGQSWSFSPDTHIPLQIRKKWRTRHDSNV